MSSCVEPERLFSAAECAAWMYLFYSIFFSNWTYSKVQIFFIFMKIKETEPFDGCISEFQDTFKIYIFDFVIHSLPVWLPSLQKMLL
jgi:hypothetical protein